MIDDSVPTSKIVERGSRDEVPKDKKMPFEKVLETVEEMPTEDRFSKAALIGLTSTYSISKCKNAPDQYQINERTPICCVFMQVPDAIHYDRRLPAKEDVIFAARLIAAGKDVVVDRHIHFEDIDYSIGGCRGKPAKDGESDENDISRAMKKVSTSMSGQ